MFFAGSAQQSDGKFRVFRSAGQWSFILYFMGTKAFHLWMRLPSFLLHRKLRRNPYVIKALRAGARTNRAAAPDVRVPHTELFSNQIEGGYGYEKKIGRIDYGIGIDVWFAGRLRQLRNGGQG